MKEQKNVVCPDFIDALSILVIQMYIFSKNYIISWCWRRLESPLSCKEIKPIIPKGNQPWIFTVRTDAKAKTPILWPPDTRSWLIRKDPDAGKDWGQKEKGMTEDEMVGWRPCLDGHEFEQTPGDSEGQGSLMCCSPWGCKESDTTFWLKDNTKPVCYINWIILHHCLNVSFCFQNSDQIF